MLIILYKMSQDCYYNGIDPHSELEQYCKENNIPGKNNRTEVIQKDQIGQTIEESRRKKRKKKPVKKIRIKRDLTNKKIITINSYNNEINKKGKRSKKNSKKIKNKFSYYFKKKSRNKIKKNLHQEKSNNFGGSIISSLTDLNEGSPGQEKKLKFDNEIIDCLFVGVEEEEYDFYNIEIISSINFNKDYQT